MTRLAFAMIATVLLSVALPTNATVIDFEEFGITTGGNVAGGDRVSQGYSILSGHNHLVNDAAGITAWNGSTWLGNVGSLVLSRLDGGAFSIYSVNAGEFSSESFPTPTGTQVIVTGNQFGGGTLTQPFSLDDVADGPGPLIDFQNVLFGPGWKNLQSVSFDPVGPDAVFFSLDNIHVTTVPLPAPLLLFASGLGLLSLMRRIRLRLRQ